VWVELTKCANIADFEREISNNYWPGHRLSARSAASFDGVIVLPGAAFRRSADGQSRLNVRN
jgi:hypothetical protein